MKPFIESQDQAPDFTLEGSDGEAYALQDVLRESHVLLVFYPGNDTPG